MKSFSDFLKIRFYYFKYVCVYLCVRTHARMCVHVSVSASGSQRQVEPPQAGATGGCELSSARTIYILNH